MKNLCRNDHTNLAVITDHNIHISCRDTIFSNMKKTLAYIKDKCNFKKIKVRYLGDSKESIMYYILQKMHVNYLKDKEKKKKYCRYG